MLRPRRSSPRRARPRSRRCLRRGIGRHRDGGGAVCDRGFVVACGGELPSRPPSTQAEPSRRGPWRPGRSYSGALHLDAMNHARSTVCGSTADGMGAGGSSGLRLCGKAPLSHRSKQKSRNRKDAVRDALRRLVSLGEGEACSGRSHRCATYKDDQFADRGIGWGVEHHPCVRLCCVYPWRTRTLGLVTVLSATAASKKRSSGRIGTREPGLAHQPDRGGWFRH